MPTSINYFGAGNTQDEDASKIYFNDVRLSVIFGSIGFSEELHYQNFK